MPATSAAICARATLPRRRVELTVGLGHISAPLTFHVQLRCITLANASKSHNHLFSVFYCFSSHFFRSLFYVCFPLCFFVCFCDSLCFFVIFCFGLCFFVSGFIDVFFFILYFVSSLSMFFVCSSSSCLRISVCHLSVLLWYCLCIFLYFLCGSFVVSLCVFCVSVRSLFFCVSLSFLCSFVFHSFFVELMVRLVHMSELPIGRKQPRCLTTFGRIQKITRSWQRSTVRNPRTLTVAR